MFVHQVCWLSLHRDVAFTSPLSQENLHGICKGPLLLFPDFRVTSRPPDSEALGKVKKLSLTSLLVRMARKKHFK